MVNSKHAAYKEQTNNYRQNIALTLYLFNRHKAHFERLEDLGVHHVPDSDSFLSEQKYVTCCNNMTSAIYDLRSMLFTMWAEALALEDQRVQGI